MNIVLYIILFTLLGSVISLTGGFILLLKKKWSHEFALQMISFSAGVLSATSFLHLLPEAFYATQNENVFLAVFVGFVLFFILERCLLYYHHHHDAHEVKPSLYLIVFGDTVHNFIDGIAIAAAFFINIPLGITTSIAVIVHEIPQEIADFSIMLSQKISKQRTILVNITSSLASLIGALIAINFSHQIEELLHLIIAFTAGVFIYIAAADLIPELHTRTGRKHKSILQMAYFFLGITVVVVLGYFIHE